MNKVILKTSFCLMASILLMTFSTSFREKSLLINHEELYETAAPVLYFKKMVVSTSALTSIISETRINSFIFQVSQPLDPEYQETEALFVKRRHRYRLIAYKHFIEGNSELITETDFFISRDPIPNGDRLERPFVPISTGGNGITSNFGNLILETARLKTEHLQRYKFLIFYPKIGQPTAGKENLNEYVVYDVYYSNDINSRPDDPEDMEPINQTKVKAIKPLLTLNPSPPD